MARSAKTYRVHRDSKTGQFVRSNTAKRRPSTTTAERVPVPGHVNPKSASAIKKISKKYDKALKRLAKRYEALSP